MFPILQTNMAKVKLDQTEKNAAIQQVKSGKSISSVARDFGIPESTLRFWIKSGRHFSKCTIDEATKRNAIQRAITRQATKSAIAREINVPESTLRFWIKKANETKPHTVPEEEKENQDHEHLRERVRHAVRNYITDVVKVSCAIIQMNGQNFATPENVKNAMNLLNEIEY